MSGKIHLINVSFTIVFAGSLVMECEEYQTELFLENLTALCKQNHDVWERSYCCWYIGVWYNT